MPLAELLICPSVSVCFRVPKELFHRGDIAIPQLYDWCALHNPDYPLFLYQDGKDIECVTYSQATVAINRAARYILSHMARDPEFRGCATIGVLANTDAITYVCVMLGILKAGCTAFLISPRNSSAAVADMLKRAGATHLIICPDAGMVSLANDAILQLSGGYTYVARHAMPSYEDLFSVYPGVRSPFDAPVELPSSYDMKAPAIILHSSGTSGHPKPISWNHEFLVADGKAAAFSDECVTGALMGAFGTPMFHALGALMYSSAPMTGFVIATFKPSSPPLVPTPEAVWDAMVATGADFSFGVPSFVERWARDSDKISHMKKMRGIFYGGAALNANLGNSLTAQGVAILPIYGCTEAGVINNYIRPSLGVDWEYWSPSNKYCCVFRPTSDDQFEVILKSGPGLPLVRCNTSEGGYDAYSTNDLVVPHPSKPGLWKIVGRIDEQIILSNGEKTNPVPLETMINDDVHVNKSLMFGRGEFQNGVLVQPAGEYAVDPNNAQQVAAFLNMIWPTIECVNNFAPQHSRIFKEMVLITNPSKPLHLTAKGTLRRNIILDEYQREIEELYASVETCTWTDAAPPTTWDQANTTAFVRAVVHNTLRHPIDDNADIFRDSGDSLQATWIRKILVRALGVSEKCIAARVPQNLVFAHPTINALAKAILDIMHAPDDHAPPPRSDDLWKYVERYSSALPARPKPLLPRIPGKDVVLITGTTSGFGCDALEHLLKDERVARVYAFNRPGRCVMEKQRAQFKKRGLDTDLLDESKFVMVEATLHERGFGIDDKLLEQIRGSVTHVMLNAWKVNFSMSIASFEIDMQGVRNFVDLALSSPFDVPPAIIFVSSIGIFANYRGPSPVPEAPFDDPAAPLGSGYSEAKWVAERILQNVHARTAVHTVVVRLGQVTGDKLGYWNESEWFPALIKSAQHQRCLPILPGKVSWVPSYEAAYAFIEMRHSVRPVLHLVHPQPTPWRTILLSLAEEIGVPLVPYKTWLAALELHAEDEQAICTNPALRLLPFFRAARLAMEKDQVVGEVESMGMARLSVERTLEVSRALNSLPTLDETQVRSWLATWKRIGFM